MNIIMNEWIDTISTDIASRAVPLQ